MQAIIHGVRIALRAGYRRILLRSDCVGAIQCVVGNGTMTALNRRDLVAMGQVGFALLASPQLLSWKIEHIYRDGNCLADRCACCPGHLSQR